MNTKSLRAVAALGWAPPHSPATRVTIARGDGRLTVRASMGGQPVIRWWDDSDEPFTPRTVPCRSICKGLAGVNEAVIGATSNGLQIYTDDFTAAFRADDAEAAETVPDGGVTLAADDVARFAWVVRSAAGTDNRYGLNGIHVEDVDGHPTALATDGSRINRARIDALAGLTLPPKTLLPRDWWHTAAKLAGKGGMRVVVVDRFVWAAGDGWAVRGRLIEGEFPAWRQVMPAAFGAEVRVDAPALMAALARVTPLAETTHYGPVVVILDDGVWKLTATGHADIGGFVRASVPVTATGWTKRGLRPLYLADVLRGVVGSVTFREVAGKDLELSMITVDLGDGRVAVVMPVRL